MALLLPATATATPAGGYITVETARAGTLAAAGQNMGGEPTPRFTLWRSVGTGDRTGAPNTTGIPITEGRSRIATGRVSHSVTVSSKDSQFHPLMGKLYSTRRAATDFSPTSTDSKGRQLQ